MSTETVPAPSSRLSHFLLSVRIVGVLLSAATITSCSKSSPTEPVFLQDSVTIVSIQPPAGTTLQAAATVVFTATVGYHLASAPSGIVLIVIEDQSFKNLSATVPQPRVTVASGTGTVTLTDQVVLPSSGVASVLVIFPLVATGAAASS
jgi:hypothetical protein